MWFQGRVFQANWVLKGLTDGGRCDLSKEGTHNCRFEVFHFHVYRQLELLQKLGDWQCMGDVVSIEEPAHQPIYERNQLK